MLRRPVLIAAFEGWNDAGDGASAASAYLARRWGAETFASIDAEEFFDFTATRPEVHLERGGVRADSGVLPLAALITLMKASGARLTFRTTSRAA